MTRTCMSMFILLCALRASFGCACVSVPSSTVEKYREASTLLVGRVDSMVVNLSTTDLFGDDTIYISVISKYKNVDRDHIAILDPRFDEICGDRFTQDSTYLIYCEFDSTRDKYRTNQCYGNLSFSYAQQAGIIDTLDMIKNTKTADAHRRTWPAANVHKKPATCDLMGRRIADLARSGILGRRHSSIQIGLAH
jgi:hypothetical protein